MQQRTLLKEIAYHTLKEMIINDEFSYDTIYSETKLAQELKISRTPLRDAVQRLFQERYIDIITSKGFRLHQMTKEDVIDTFQIRSAIEGYCTMLHAKNAKDEETQKLFERLEGLLDQQEKIAATTREISEFVKYDNEFHFEIVIGAGNRTFDNLFETYIYKIRHLAAQSLEHKGRMEETVSEHRMILETMKKGDTAKIYDVTLQHMERPKGINLEDLETSK